MTRHSLDLFSLLSGLVLSGIALAALFGVGVDVGPWIWPTVLVGSGVVVLVLAVSGRSRDADADTDGAEGGSDDPLLEAARAEVEAEDHTTS